MCTPIEPNVFVSISICSYQKKARDMNNSTTMQCTLKLYACFCRVSKIKSINKYFTLNSFLFGISHSTQLSCRFSSISIAFDYPLAGYRGYEKERRSYFDYANVFYVNAIFVIQCFFSACSIDTDEQRKSYHKYINSIKKILCPMLFESVLQTRTLGLKFIFSQFCYTKITHK